MQACMVQSTEISLLGPRAAWRQMGSECGEAKGTHSLTLKMVPMGLIGARFSIPTFSWSVCAGGEGGSLSWLVPLPPPHCMPSPLSVCLSPIPPGLQEKPEEGRVVTHPSKCNQENLEALLPGTICSLGTRSPLPTSPPRGT